MGLTAAEAALLAAYRSLDADQQEQLVTWARYLADHFPADAGAPAIPIEQGWRDER